jgi:hypothetical protein
MLEQMECAVHALGFAGYRRKPCLNIYNSLSSSLSYQKLIGRCQMWQHATDRKLSDDAQGGKPFVWTRLGIVVSIARIGVSQRVHALYELNVCGRPYQGICGSLVHQIVLVKEGIELVHRRRIGQGPRATSPDLARRIVCTTVVPVIGKRDAVCSKGSGEFGSKWEIASQLRCMISSYRNANRRCALTTEAPKNTRSLGNSQLTSTAVPWRGNSDVGA